MTPIVALLAGSSPSGRVLHLVIDDPPAVRPVGTPEQVDMVSSLVPGRSLCGRTGFGAAASDQWCTRCSTSLTLLVDVVGTVAVDGSEVTPALLRLFGDGELALGVAAAG